MKLTHITRLVFPVVCLVIVLFLTLFQVHGQASIKLEKIPLEGKLSEPTGLAFRPNHNDQLWITNHGNDSITIVNNPGKPGMIAERKTDAYAEHFVARPTGIVFGFEDTFAVSNDSINEVRGMKFIKHPERNKYFVNSHFMGPTLFSAKSYSLAGQNKKYLEDWPQPGIGHDPPDKVPSNQCPKEFWFPAASRCYWPREGSHLDMLHESPLSMGIVHEQKNVYFVLDGCGNRDAQGQCQGNGHLVRYDFNRDHQEGNGFHGDGAVWRYPRVTFERLDGVASGMVIKDGWLYFANPKAGRVERVRPSQGKMQTLVKGWAGKDGHYAPQHHQVGTGATDWVDASSKIDDGEDPNNIKAWIQDNGDLTKIQAVGKDWIQPLEILGEYAYVYDVPKETIIAEQWLKRPAGLAADDRALYVADYGSGWIAAFDWTTRRLLWRHQSNLRSITGLAINPNQSRELYLTDSKTNSLYRLQW